MTYYITANPTVEIQDSSSIVTNIRDFIGPLALGAFGILALVFLVRRQITQMVMFIAIGAVVFLLLYSPEIVPAIGETVKNWITT